MITLAYALQSKDNTSSEALDLANQAEAIVNALLAKAPANKGLSDMQIEIDALRKLVAAWRAQAAQPKAPR